MAYSDYAGAITAGIGYLGDRSQAQSNTNAANQAANIAAMTNQTNLDIAEMNIAAMMERFNMSYEMALNMYKDQLLGNVDALGNATYFDEKRGWIVDLSDRGNQLVDASSRQEILDRTVVDRHNREREQRQADLQRGEGATAQSLLNEYDRVNRVTNTELADLTYGANKGGRSDAEAALGDVVARTSARQGNMSNFGNVVSEMGKQNVDYNQRDKASAMLAGVQGGDSITNQKRADLGNQFFPFRTSSVQPWTGMSQPTSAGGMNVPSTTGAAQMLSQALNQPVGQQPYQQSDFSPAMLTLAQGNQTKTNYDGIAALINAGGNFYDDRKSRTNTSNQI